ncbi:hypothetical protein GWC95_17835 [Sediminibacterium roseum]|uniref:Chain length determinant protein n=1 Tax=Sediminibacterium roseum TaxID=1978412 RepID=A0ABW9ZX98_9BACT|nr:hypothetical protein [Sediminibacterium roseum]NCI51791.1 hypothetical protein [Sediminibacterium roseum]
MNMQTSSFNLITTSAVLLRRWKFILAFVVVCVLVAAITVFVVPKYFRSAATIVSANTTLADKGRLFNQNINGLYSYFGSGDDLDRIQGIAERDTTFLQLVDEFALVSYYKLKNDDSAVLRKKASICLKKNISLQKTEQGQLQVIAWTKDKKLSADLVNRLVDIVQQTGTQIWRSNYNQQIEKFDSTLSVMQKEYATVLDSAKKVKTESTGPLRLQQLYDRIQSFSKVSDEFKLASQTLPPLLYVLEPASPAAFAQRPDKPAVIIAAALLAFVFACIVVLVSDRKTVS